MAGPRPLTAELARAALAEAGVGPGAARVRAVERLAGGVSNLTYRVDRVDAPSVVLRLQRAGGIFEPYDVAREARVLQTLAPTAVPVPKVLAVVEASTVLGAPFFVMEFVDAPHMGQIQRSRLVSAAYVEAVAGIHAVPWREAGFEFLDAPAPGPGAAARDLDAVNARARRYGHDDDPFIAELGAWLAAHVPHTDDLVLCHGDINVFNYLFHDERVVAVVDWEQAHIGDRQSDLGLLAALSYLLGARGEPHELPFLADYAAHTGAPLPKLPYFVLAGLHKLAVIHRIWSAEGDSPPWYTWEQLVRSAALVRPWAEHDA